MSSAEGKKPRRRKPPEGPRLIPKPDLRLILCTVPAAPVGTASQLARLLVEQRFAACVNIIPAVQSVYLWEKTLQSETEALMVIKTTSRRCRACAQALKEHHPYDVPEIVVIGAEAVNEPYWLWLQAAIDGQA